MSEVASFAPLARCQSTNLFWTQSSSLILKCGQKWPLRSCTINSKRCVPTTKQSKLNAPTMCLNLRLILSLRTIFNSKKEHRRKKQKSRDHVMILPRANASAHPAPSRMLNKQKASKDLRLLASHSTSAPNAILHNTLSLIVYTAECAKNVERKDTSQVCVAQSLVQTSPWNLNKMGSQSMRTWSLSKLCQRKLCQRKLLLPLLLLHPQLEWWERLSWLTPERPDHCTPMGDQHILSLAYLLKFLPHV